MILGDQYESVSDLPITLPTNLVSIDTETTGLNPWKGHRVFCLNISMPDGTEVYWHKDHNPGTRHIVDRILRDPTLHKVMQNSIFDVRMLEYSGFPTIRGPVWDTMIFGHLLDGRDARGGLNLNSLCIKYLPDKFRKVKKEVDDWFASKGMQDRSDLDFSLLPKELVQKRVQSDSRLTLMLFNRFYNTVRKLFPYMLWLEHRLLRVIYRMEDRGIMIDPVEIERQYDLFSSVEEEILEFFEDYLDAQFISLSSKDVLEKIAAKSGMDKILANMPNASKSDRTGRISLNADNLMKTKHPAGYMILAARAALKMRDTFLAQAERFQIDGVLHPGWKQCGTLSGRFSCVRPAMQTIPKDADSRPGWTTEETADFVKMTGMLVEQHVKRIFVSRPGYVHMHSDKAQAEMCVLAHYANDPVLSEIVSSGNSIHTELCQRLYGTVTEGLRTRVKAVVFGFVYGAGLPTTAKKIGEDISVARDTRDRLGMMVPGLGTWNNQLKRDIMSLGYVQTIHGRRHYLGRHEDYMAVNRMCQGTIGDEVKSRMVAIDQYLDSVNRPGNVLMNIHDDVCTEIEEGQVERHLPEVYRIMQETSHEFNVPLASDCSITYGSWAHKIKVKNVSDYSTYTKEAWQKAALGECDG